MKESFSNSNLLNLLYIRLEGSNKLKHLPVQKSNVLYDLQLVTLENSEASCLRNLLFLQIFGTSQLFFYSNDGQH